MQPFKLPAWEATFRCVCLSHQGHQGVLFFLGDSSTYTGGETVRCEFSFICRLCRDIKSRFHHFHVKTFHVNKRINTILAPRFSNLYRWKIFQLIFIWTLPAPPACTVTVLTAYYTTVTHTIIIMAGTFELHRGMFLIQFTKFQLCKQLVETKSPPSTLAEVCTRNQQTYSHPSIHPWLLCSNCYPGWFSRRLLLPLTGIEDERRQHAFRALGFPQISLLCAFEMRHPPWAYCRPPAITNGGVGDPCWANRGAQSRQGVEFEWNASLGWFRQSEGENKDACGSVACLLGETCWERR